MPRLLLPWLSWAQSPPLLIQLSQSVLNLHGISDLGSPTVPPRHSVFRRSTLLLWADFFTLLTHLVNTSKQNWLALFFLPPYGSSSSLYPRIQAGHVAIIHHSSFLDIYSASHNSQMILYPSHLILSFYFVGLWLGPGPYLICILDQFTWLRGGAASHWFSCACMDVLPPTQRASLCWSFHSLWLGSSFLSKFYLWSTSVPFPSLLQSLLPGNLHSAFPMVALLSLVAASGHWRIFCACRMCGAHQVPMTQDPSCAYALCPSAHFTPGPELRAHSDLKFTSPPVSGTFWDSLHYSTRPRPSTLIKTLLFYVDD